MTLCSKNHEEICYEGYHCPLCEQININEDLKAKIETLEDDVQDLHKQLED